ncbi:hypothetical protein QBC34DRAFT_449547 [Podospora aff. communis PSN243]|uniref:Apple domain-containing protein n=1 Tax=Podospora aff. communis PSN243 TaxID=3040156 RepID=A0AAV9GK61_9PEZI|nr:hypothetical protein QBC34DRAFT_449547 [Podospora aff. communis PSN243]
MGFEKKAVERRQQGASPCPNRNGTQIGTTQPFTLSCGTDIGGNVLNSMEAFDLVTCAEICSSFHPRCDGVSFDGLTCQLKARLSPQGVRTARRIDSAIAIFPGASSNCASVGASQSALGKTFSIACGTVIAGFDISQAFAPTFQDCMGMCSTTTGCAGVSFDASQDQGFKNCYLKTIVTDAGTIVPDGRVDTALIQGVGNAPLPNSAGGGGNPGGGQGVATIPLPLPTPQQTGAAVFTPPGNGAGSPAATGTLITDLFPQPTQTTPGFVFPTGGNTNNLGSTAPADAANQEDMGTSNAWIAAPVVGSIAAIALIVISFIMLKRRRLGNRMGSNSSNSSTDSLQQKKANISRPKAISTMFMSWLPTAKRGSRGSRGSGGISRSRSGMGNFSEVTGKQPASRSSMRTSVTGLVRPGLAIGGERLDDVEEGGDRKKMELRNSLNGLGQNRWS